MSAATISYEVEANSAMPPQSLERRTWTMAEACKLLGIPYSTGCALANEGRFPCRVVRAGARFYVPKDALDQLLSADAA